MRRNDDTGHGGTGGAGRGTVLYLDCSRDYMTVCLCQHLELYAKKKKKKVNHTPCKFLSEFLKRTFGELPVKFEYGLYFQC